MIRARLAASVVGCMLACALASSCAHTRALEGRDAPFVEVLRLKITKVRHAIEETRRAIVMSRGTPYLAELYLRLGELLSEEARYHYQVAYEREQHTSESLHVPQVRLLKEEAIDVYETILRSYPDASNADQVLFNIAQERRELGEFDNPDDDHDMVGALDRLVENFPTSHLRTEALLTLGDYHFDRSELADARRYYEQITSSSETSPVSDLAHYKLGWVWVNLDNCVKALDEFEAAVHAARELHGDQELERPTDAPTRGSAGSGTGAGSGRTGNQGIDVRRAAITDLAYCYAQERPSDSVLTYLRGLAHDRPTYVAGLERMARRYETTNEVNGSLLVTRELLRLAAADEDRLEDARALHTALRRRNTYSGIGADIQLVLGALQRYQTRASVTDDARRHATDEFEVYIRDLLTRAQSALDRVDEDRRTAVALDLADGYEAYLATFTTGRQHLAMMQNSVDVLADAGRYYDAGMRSLAVASAQRRGREQQNALYDAVVHFQSAMEHTSDVHVERIVTRAALRRAGEALLAYRVSPEQERRVKLDIARTYYDEGNLAEAIDHLSALAYEFPRTDEAVAAINLVLDSYNTLNDYDGLQAASQRFLAAGGPATDALRASIRPIAQAAEQRMLDEVSLEAAGEDGHDLTPLVEFANAHRGTELGERALLNAFVAARAIGDTSQLYRLGDQVAHDYPHSTQLPGILATLGQTAIARFEYGRAVELLEQAARADETQRVRLLLAAGDLRDQLGDRAAARRSYEQAIQAAADPRAQALPAQKLAMLLEREGRAQQTISALTPYASLGVPEVTAVLGLAQIAAGHPEEAETTLQGVVSAGAAASPEALARAHLGMGEVLLAAVNAYPAIETPDALEEYVTVVDVTQQSYLTSVQQGNPDVGAVALGRLAALARAAAARVRGAHIDAQMTDEERGIVRQALTQRVEALEQTARDAIRACADEAWNVPRFSPAVRRCLRGADIDSARIEADSVSDYQPGPPPRDADQLQRQIARNPDDMGALLELGTRYLDAGDAHAARLVASAAVDKGGGPVALNLLGVASARAGDTGGALDAFAKAAQAGLEIARQNLAALLREENMNAAAETALHRYPHGRPGGISLGRSGGHR